MFEKKVSMKYKEAEPFAKPLNLADFPHVHTSDLLKIANYLPKCGVGGPWIAGGSVWRTVNNEPLNKCDIDVFFHDKEQLNDAMTQMDGYPLVRNILQKTKNKFNTTYKIHANRGVFNKTIEVQFIHMKFHKSLDALLQSFDFTVCQFAWNGENIYAAPKSIDDLKSRLLRIYKTGNPKSLFQHMLRYMENGFTLQNDETKKLISNILSLNPWDKAYMKGYNDSYEKDTEKYGGYDIAGYDTGGPTTGVVGGGRNAWGQTERQVVDTYIQTQPTPAMTAGDGTPVVNATFTTTQNENYPPNFWATAATMQTQRTEENLVGWDEPVGIIDEGPVPVDPEFYGVTNNTYRTRNTETAAEAFERAAVRPEPTPVREQNLRGPQEIMERGMPEQVQERNVREPVNIVMPAAPQPTNNADAIENEIAYRMNTPRYENPRPPRGPGRFDEDRRNPNFRNIFTGEVQVPTFEIRRANDGEQQERR